MLKLLKILSVLIILFCLFFSRTKANYTFYESFDTASFASWITLDDHNTPEIINTPTRSYGRFYPLNDKSFAYLAHKLESQRIVSTEFDFYYSSFSGTQGAGVMLTDDIPIFSQNPPNDQDKYSIGIWPIKGAYYLVSTLCDNSETCNLPIYYRALFKIDNNTWNKIIIRYYSDVAEVLLNGASKILIYGDYFQPMGLYIGNPVIATENQRWSDFYIDNLTIEYGDPTLFVDYFPFLSQMDSRWVGTEYDSASEWAPLNQRGIGRWGCALTSVAMVLQKYKVKMPDGTEALPDKLNTWLLGNNGYIGPGLVNWIAITRLAKESFDAGKAETKLEFVRTNSTADMKYPAILGLPGHFVLAHDQQVPNWRINDPALNTGGTTLSMSTTIKSVNRFVPSNTDLSYLLFASDNPLDLTFTTATGSAIPLPWTDEHLTDDISGSNSPTMYTAMVPKPENGTYDLRVQNNGNIPDKLMIYMYDEEGLVKTQNLDLLPGETLYTINYDKHDAANSEVAIVDITAPDTPALLLPPNGSLSNKLDLVLKWNTVSDPSAPIEYEYRSGNVTTTSFDNQIDISSWPDGVYDWSVRACDSAKNCSPWSNVWTFTIDNTPPLYVSTTIFDGWYKTTQTATFNYSDSNLRDDYLAPTCEITIEGNAVLCTIDPMVCDRARNCNTETQNSNPAMIDLSPPSSLFTLPSTITNWNGRITGTANDDVSGIQKVELSITKPDASTTTALASGTDNWEYTITNPLEGEYTIYSVASDKAGNSQTEDMKVTLINSIPTAKLPKPPAMLIADDFGQLIIGVWSTAKDAKKYRVYLGTSQREMKQVAETKHSWWVSNKLTKGKYYLGVKSVDKNGNESKMSNVIKIEIRSVFPWRR